MAKYTKKLNLKIPGYTDNVDIPQLLEENYNIIDENISDVIKLLCITDSTPTEYNEGDKYYNATTNLIYEVVDNSWNTGKVPKEEALYINNQDKNLYYYNGTEMKKISGSGSSTIDKDDILVNNMTGNETDKAPTVAAVKDAIDYINTYINNLLNSCNVVTDGPPVKTFEKRNGKDLYHFRKSIGTLPNSTVKKVDVDRNLVDFTNVEVYEIYGIARETNSRWTPLPYNNVENVNYGMAIDLRYTTNQIVVECRYNRSNMSGYVDILFTYPD